MLFQMFQMWYTMKKTSRMVIDLELCYKLWLLPCGSRSGIHVNRRERRAREVLLEKMDFVELYKRFGDMLSGEVMRQVLEKLSIETHKTSWWPEHTFYIFQSVLMFVTGQNLWLCLFWLVSFHFTHLTDNLNIWTEKYTLISEIQNCMFLTSHNHFIYNLIYDFHVWSLHYK